MHKKQFELKLSAIYSLLIHDQMCGLSTKQLLVAGSNLTLRLKQAKLLDNKESAVRPTK